MQIRGTGVSGVSKETERSNGGRHKTKKKIDGDTGPIGENSPK